MKGKLQIRHLLVALFVIPALYLNFIVYHAGAAWVALAMLIVIGVGALVFLSESAYTFRYLFPGFLGFGLFVIFPIAYMVFLSFTKYSSQNLLTFDRSLALLLQETIPAGTESYKYKLYAQENAQYILYLEDQKDPTKRFASAPFDLKPGEQAKAEPETAKLTALAPAEEVSGRPLEMGQITRERLFMPMRTLQFALPDDRLVAMEGLTKFGSRERVWSPNQDGSLTSKKDGTVIRPDFRLGFFVNEKGEQVGVGFRTFTGLDNYIQILTDPRIQGPFFRIFVWTVTFSGLSVILTFAAGMLLSVASPAGGSRLSESLSDAVDSSLRGPGGALDPYPERNVQSGFWRGEPDSQGCFWFRSRMGNRSMGCARDGPAGEYLAGLPLHDADLLGNAPVDSHGNL